MLLPAVFCLLIGSLVAIPQEDFRSNLEFLEYGTNLAEPAYRLVDTVYPHTMNIELDVYLSESRFNGLVAMGVEVREAGLTQIVFHQKVVAIEGVNVVNANNVPVSLQFPTPFETDDYYELLKVNFASPIPIGNYTISVRYLGQINENPLDRGFYKGYYFLNNQEREYATTQFQPYHARKAFPCFDEPMFKSQYVIAITRARTLSPSYSNMAIAQTTLVSDTRVRELFHPTPIISAYLVAFHVSDFVETELTSTDARPFKIISRQGVTDQHEYAAHIGLQITLELDDFFGIQYHEMGQGVLMKNDHIALPDFPSGAMENWGMVNYREAYLLYDEKNTNLNNKIFIATIMAHELGHKWFGNLVTCFWWSNLWLNESFASFFEYFGAHWADPSLELADQFVVDYVHSALTADASSGATPMNWEDVADNPSITSHFSTTSYAKGASVLKMMEHFVGFRNFRTALRYYLRDNAYEIGTPSDMYAAFRQAASEDFAFLRDYPGVDVGAVFDSWVQNRGAPVLNVEFNTQTGVISVSQQRYQLSGNRPDTLWNIPLTFTHQGAINFANTRPSSILTTRTATIQSVAGDNWVLFNLAQSGLYRVNYDESNWQRLGAYLKSSNREQIHKLNRAQIVNDLLFFIRSNDVNHTIAFDVLDFLRNETDYYVWNGALTQLDWIRRRYEHLPYAHRVFSAYLLEIMDTVIRHLGFEERATDSTSTILNRMQIMNYACNLGHAGCVLDAQNKWRQWRENNSNLVPVNARRYVYCIGLREGNAADYTFLFNQYESSENTADMVVILRALACTRDETSLNHFLRNSMENRKIRIHDRTNAWSFALQGNPENQPQVLSFLYNNFAQIRDAYGGEARLNIVINAIPAFLTDFAVIQQFQNWVYQNQIALQGSFPNGVAAVNAAISNLQWGNENSVEIYNYLLSKVTEPVPGASTTFVASSILLLAATLLHLLR
ncbi:membrane alanyl aminopeptidase-like [Anticarsia gemmatalis]|uniref:membrane alanyl aminopeptidase-like n=1 Tax=Anticarsia gemmatalis TaxID=129554 RepID=UPI003F768E2D